MYFAFRWVLKMKEVTSFPLVIGESVAQDPLHVAQRDIVGKNASTSWIMTLKRGSINALLDKARHIRTTTKRFCLWVGTWQVTLFSILGTLECLRLGDTRRVTGLALNRSAAFEPCASFFDN
eukprot:02011_3